MSTGDILLHLFADFPTKDVTVRLVILIIVFTSADNLHSTTVTIRNKLETLGLLPLTQRDAFNILVNPFVERYNSLLDFARSEIGINEDGSTGMSAKEVEKLIEDVGARCVDIACKVRTISPNYR